MSIKIWVHWDSNYRKQIADSIINQLTSQGIEIRNHGDECFCNSGVIFSNGITSETFEELHELSHNGQTRVLTCFCCEAIPGDTIWKLMDAGATDVLTCSNHGLIIHEIISRLRRWERVNTMVNSPDVKQTLIGESQALKTILSQIVEVAYFTSAPVLILGESGTGKELLANLIHTMDPRPDKGELVILDCSTIVPELAGSEFFGHERGAFTGAATSRDGVFALANGGTLFLDEIGELSPAMQTQLLRVIQEKTYKRVGGNAWQRTSFRLICATNRDLMAQVQRGEFRADLYYRIAGFICCLPPLRERTDDILPLASHFLKQSSTYKNIPILDKPVQEYLLCRQYPGNVRDLKQVVSRMLCRYAGEGPLTVGCIPPDERPALSENRKEWRDINFERAIRIALSRGMGLKVISKDTEEIAIRIAVDEADGNLQRAAQRLGVTDRALQLRRAAQRQKNST
ncbi:sigma 54-interacting transcriptional regulator [Nitrosomonas sp.]|uniref:sigma 54-interacting transcriptional regulator n=1 Tax=Nitrosomonas sp. TaxID=42353 RepID=UPI0025F3934D|nr:sigma 54-interacting transcriptional regulator [Nitrosomonas sp.]MCC6916819.1 sigma-54-dependent Fis family transcriptional regulator [Nitrosomonas sp.]